MNTETEGEGGELTGELTEGAGRRPRRRHRWRIHGCGGIAPPSSGYDGKGKHLAHSQATTTAPHQRDTRVAGMPSNQRWQQRPAADIEKKSRSPSKAKLERIEQLEGELTRGDEQRRWRWTEAKSPDLHGQKR
jgi:hypothetical protein